MYRELLVRICDLDSQISLHLLCDEIAIQHVPRHQRIELLIHRSSSRRPSKVFRYVSTISRWRVSNRIKRIAPDLFHSTYYTESPVAGIKSVATVYDLVDFEFPLFHPNGIKFIERQASTLKRADQIISISDATAASAVQTFNLDLNRVRTIHLASSQVFSVPSEEEKIEFRFRTTRGRPYFLFVGALSPYKNAGTLIRAFARIATNCDHLLVLAGHSVDGSGAVFDELAIELGVERRILKLFRPSDNELRLAYAASCAFVFPSLQEGFGIPLLEAMGCGAAVIASDIPVFREVCAGAAMFFEPHDHETLGSLLLGAIEQSTTHEFRRRGLLRAQCFSWERSAEALLTTYRDVVGSDCNASLMRP